MRFVIILGLLTVLPGAGNASPTAPGAPVEVGDATLYRVVSDGNVGVDVLMGSTTFPLAMQRVDGSGVPYWSSGPVFSHMSLAGSSVKAVSDKSGGMIFVTTNTLRAQRISGTGGLRWSEPGVSISSLTSVGTTFDVLADGSGGAFISWDEGTDIRAQRIDSLGHALWTAGGVVVCNAAGTQSSPKLCSDATGGVIIAWQDGRTATPAIYAQRLSGVGAPQWTANGISMLSSVTSVLLGVVSDGSSGMCVAGLVGTTTVVAQRISSAGSVLWGPGTAIAGALTQVVLCRDGGGGLILGWAGPDNLIHAQRVNGAGSVVWAGGSILVAPSIGYQFSPGLVADGAGGAVFVWQDDRNSGWGSDLYGQRVDASGLPQWDPAGVVVCDAIGSQSGAVPVVASDGSVNVVWTDGRRSLDGLSAIYSQRLSLAGVTLTPDRERPALAGIRDVSGDQGGYVRLRWQASALDAPTFSQAGLGQPGPPLITGYRIWRRVPESQVAALRASRGTSAVISRRGDDRAVGAVINWWESIGFVPFEFLSGYGFTANTSRDSMAGSNPYTAFFVTAVGRDSALFYASDVDSGYSVDNLAPPPPSLFTAGYQNVAVHLHWRPNMAADFSRFELNRGDALDFTTSPANMIYAGPDTGYADAGAPSHYYKLTAVDVHGNRSAYVQIRPQEVSAVPGTTGSLELAVGPATPNPSYGATSFTLRLASGLACGASVYDGSGRRIRNLFVEPLETGARIDWNGLDGARRPVRAGLYFVRVTSGARQIVRTVTLIR